MKLSTAATLPTRFGRFKIQAVLDGDTEHIVIYTGALEGRDNVPFRIHSECLTSEVLGSMKCDCKEQLDAALEIIQERGYGALLYLRQEGRGIGLFNKVEAYALQDQGYDTIEANVRLGLPVDRREYGLAARVLRHFGVRSVDLFTNNPLKIAALEDAGIRIANRMRLKMAPNPHNMAYLEVKTLRMNHY